MILYVNLNLTKKTEDLLGRKARIKNFLEGNNYNPTPFQNLISYTLLRNSEQSCEVLSNVYIVISDLF